MKLNRFFQFFDGQADIAGEEKLEGQAIESCTVLLFICQNSYCPLLGKDKFPLGEGYIFESKFPLVVRIGLVARDCGSGIGQSHSNSVGSSKIV